MDALVNNAGIAGRDRLPYVDLDTWRRTFDVNVTGPLLGIQALVPLMPAGSSIVNVCSVAALSGHVAAAYTASKWALRGLSRTASLELGARGHPGQRGDARADRDSADGVRLAGVPGAALAEIPLGRTGTVDDVAPLIVFLVSDESAYLNGAEIVVDGGLTAHVSHKGVADAISPAAPA